MTRLTIFLCLSFAIPIEAAIVKRALRTEDAGENLLKDDSWRFWRDGFVREGGVLVCDNGDDARVHRGVSQTVTLNQSAPRPIVAEAWSRAENVGGSRGGDYSLYLDLVYMDGTPLWGQISPFSVGTHDWERKEVVVPGSCPVRRSSSYTIPVAGRAIPCERLAS